MRLLLPALSAVLGLAGCESMPDGFSCTEVFVFGVNVTVVDEADVPVIGATVTITEGDFDEVLMEMQPGSYAGAGERAGTYTITVAADGFAPVTISDLFVDEDVCHVIPVVQDVVLTPVQ